MKIFKRILKILLLLFLLITLTVAAWAIWERNRDPVAVLNKNPGIVKTIVNEDLTSRFLSENREYRHVILSTENIGDIEVYISLPLIRYTETMPAIIVLGGLEIGIHNFRYISEPGNNAIIIYQYPYHPDQWRENSAITQIPIIRDKIFEIPSQIITLVDWLSQQPWVDKRRINLSGYSFGAFFVPAIYHLDKIDNQRLGPGVIAYGGADISLLLETNLKKVSQPWKWLGAWLAETAIYPIEPAVHLPEMENEFLIINGTKDNQIPEESWRKLQSLTPEPKTVIILEEGHMHPRKPELTMKLVSISKKWLIARNIINY
jgi:hypothetical protein